MTLIIVLAAGFALAYVNGANDVSKGIATLVGSGVTNYRHAILGGTLWTGIGGITGAFLARAMVQTFGGGLLLPGNPINAAAAPATIACSALWAAIATSGGLPVSPTPSICGYVTRPSCL